MTLLPDIVQVEHSKGSYPVVIHAGLLDSIGEWLEAYLPSRRVFVVSDEQVWAAQGERLVAALLRSSIGLIPLIVPAGEQSKSWDRLSQLLEQLIELGAERSDTILAFGGGVVGDLAGFASAILKRGCGTIQVPTTLLAQVDSSVGGKTGINMGEAKNLVGAFHQPLAVFIDPTTLETLPKRQLAAGYAEVVKYGLIADAGFFAWCERCGTALLSGHSGLRSAAIAKSVRTKAAIVAKDERETSGKRALLNFGHSFAHALEAEAGLGDALLHGEAVAIGMCLAYRFSSELGLCDAAIARRVAAHLSAAGLPTQIADVALRTSGRALAEHIRHDKKAVRGKPWLVLSEGIGSAFMDDRASLEDIASFLDRELAGEAELHAALR